MGSRRETHNGAGNVEERGETLKNERYDPRESADEGCCEANDSVQQAERAHEGRVPHRGVEPPVAVVATIVLDGALLLGVVADGDAEDDD